MFNRDIGVYFGNAVLLNQMISLGCHLANVHELLGTQVCYWHNGHRGSGTKQGGEGCF